MRNVAEEVLGASAAVNMRVGGSDRVGIAGTVCRRSSTASRLSTWAVPMSISCRRAEAVAKVHTLAAFDYLTNRS